MAAAADMVGMLQRVMAMEGPVVEAVLIPAESGKPRQVQVDMTPRLKETNKLLGGSPTFVGQVATQWPSEGVVIMQRRDAEEVGLLRNPATLPAPFHEAETYGPLLLVRMDRNSEPANFTLKEYRAFEASPPVAAAEDDEIEDMEDGGEEEEEEEEEVVEEEEEEDAAAEEDEGEEEDVEERDGGDEEGSKEESEEEESPDVSESKRRRLDEPEGSDDDDDDDGDVYSVEKTLGRNLARSKDSDSDSDDEDEDEGSDEKEGSEALSDEKEEGEEEEKLVAMKAPAPTNPDEAPFKRTRGGRKLAAEQGKAPVKPGKKALPRKGENGIWIGNLSFTTTEGALRAFFKSCGTVTRINLVKGADGRNRGFAYVDFLEPEAVPAARQLSERRLDNRQVLIKAANDFTRDHGKQAANSKAEAPAEADAAPEQQEKKKPHAKKQHPPSATVFVGNLSFQCTKEILENALSAFGTVQQSRLATFDDTGRCKGYGYVDFASVVEAKKAVKASNLRIDGRVVRVEFASGAEVKRGQGQASAGGPKAPKAPAKPSGAASKAKSAEEKQALRAFGEEDDDDHAAGDDDGESYEDRTAKGGKKKAAKKVGPSDPYGGVATFNTESSSAAMSTVLRRKGAAPPKPTGRKVTFDDDEE